MKIEKYKYIGNSKYKLILDEEEYIIYEDIIIKYNILSKKEVSKEELDIYIKDNDYYEAYYKAIKYIKVKMRSSKEINSYLTKNNYDNLIVEKIIYKLKNENYLNDDIYTKNYIYDQINLKLIGPLKIKQDLLKHDIDINIIENNLSIFNKEKQYEKINKIISKEIRLNTNKSSNTLKNKILITLGEKGFYKEDIIECLNSFDINDDNAYKKEYKKIYDKLSKKYEGKMLEYKIKEKLYQKGFRVN